MEWRDGGDTYSRRQILKFICCHEWSGWYCPISSSLQPDVQQRSAPAEEDKDEQQWRGIRRCHMLGAPLQYVIDMHGIDQDLRLSYVKLFVVIE